MKKSNPAGFTLLELIVSVSILALFMGMVAWFGKGATDHRIRSEDRLKLLEKLQAVMFLIENDFLSARRHTLGNVLCNNVVFSVSGAEWRTTSDPGFDSEYTRLTNDPAVRNQWFFPFAALVPGQINPVPRAGRAFVDPTIAGRLHGTGSLAIQSNLPGNTYYSVRSPDISELVSQEYVLAGWVRGENRGNVFLVPQLAFQENIGNGLPGMDIRSVSDNRFAIQFGNWVYLSVQIPANQIDPNKTYNVYLRTQVQNGDPTEVLTAHFDSITLTPETDIAQIDFDLAKSMVVSNSNVNLHKDNSLGTVFYQSNPLDGILVERKYIFGDGDQRTFPPTRPNLLRYSSTVPFFHRSWRGDAEWPERSRSVPGEPRLDQPLPNLSSLTIAWVGSWSGGSNRPIRITATVREPNDPNKAISLTRVLTPPTD